LRSVEFTNNKEADTQEPDVIEPDATQPVEPVLFSATYQQKFDAIQNALEGSVVKDSESNITEETRYWVEDFDDTYTYVAKSVWTPEDYNRTYGRFTYTFDETNVTATISSEFEEMVVGVWLTKEENQKLQDERGNYELLKTEFDNYKEQYSTPNSEVDELKTFKQQKLAKDREDEEAELFKKFEDELFSVEEYKTIKENAKNYTIEDLKKELFALLGKKNAKFSVKKKDSLIKIPVDSQEGNDNEDPYGGLHAKYGKKPISKN
jgi:hypothetical protein